MAQSYTKLLYHVVFSTKHREMWIDDAWREELHAFISGIVRNRKGELIAAGGIPDHIHLLVRLAADRAVSDVVREIKSNSCAWLRDRGVPFGWQDGYGAFTLSPSAVGGVTAYIDNQVRHHAREDFRSEFMAMLMAAGEEYDAETMWE